MARKPKQSILVLSLASRFDDVKRECIKAGVDGLFVRMYGLEDFLGRTSPVVVIDGYFLSSEHIIRKLEAMSNERSVQILRLSNSILSVVGTSALRDGERDDHISEEADDVVDTDDEDE